MARITPKRRAAFLDRESKKEPQPMPAPGFIPAGTEPDGTEIDLGDDDEWHDHMHGGSEKE